MANQYAKYAASTAITPQTQPIPGREAAMTPNNAGGYGFVMDDWARLERFLILGSDSGTFYVGEQKLTAENAVVVIRCLKVDGERVVEMARDINLTNRAPKTDQHLFTLALAMKHGDAAAKRAVATAVPRVVRTGTHLLHFVAMLDSLGGWNRSKRRVIANWFNTDDPDWVAYQCLKYQNRDGWRMADALRVSHPLPKTAAQNAVFSWVAGKPPPEGANKTMPQILLDHMDMGAYGNTPIECALWGIVRNIPREALPTEAVNTPEVQRALLPTMPPHALIRNLGNLTASGVLANGSPEVQTVARTLGNNILMQRARVHPFAVLLASLVYKQGHGVRGHKTWTPVNGVLAALEDAYDASFVNVAPTNKRILVAIDISGSMTAPCIGTPIPANLAASAMALTLARTEPNAVVVQFDTEVRKQVSVTKRTSVMSLEAHDGGGTDLGAPLWWALGENPGIQIRSSMFWSGYQVPVVGPSVTKIGERQAFDAIVILTDNETWAGRAHLSELLTRYRRTVNAGTKLIVCAMAANHASVVDPEDGLSLGCAGLDASLPSLVADFIQR